MERLDVNNEEEKRSVAVVLLAAVSGRRYGRQTVPNRVCKQCTKPFYHRPRGKSRMNPGTFCSRACAIASRKGRVPKSMLTFVTPESTKAERIRANGLVNMRLRRGWFTKPAICMCCGAKPVRDSHHVDYTKPDEVHWLCRSCHMRVHQNPSLLDGIAPMVLSDQRQERAA
jgi:hypothetical protein